MKYKRLIILLIVFTMTFNFIFIPKSQASIVLTLGGLALTYEVAQAVYLTALAAAAIGVTFLTWEEAKKFHDMVEGTSPGPIEQYPEWEGAREQVQQSKADLARENWFKQWDLEVLPGGLPPDDPDPQGNKRGILGLMGAIGVMGGFINNYLSMFKTLDLKEGENNLLIKGNLEDIYIYEGMSLTYPIQPNTNYGIYHIGDKSLKIWTTEKMSYGGYYLYYQDEVNTYYEVIDYPSDITLSTEHVPAYNLVRLNMRYYNRKWSTITLFSNTYDTEFPEGNETIEDSNINIIVKQDSPYIDNDLLPKIPQPNLIPIPRYNPSTTPVKNPNGTPKPGIHSILNPDGSIDERFYGTIDDLLRDIVMNTPIDEILNPDSNPYIIEPGEDYITITRPELDPTIPYPQPNLPTRPEIWPPLTPDPETWPTTVPYPEWPQPDPETWPDSYPYPTKPDPWPPVDPVPWPDPDTWPTTIPYPYPDPDTWPTTIPYPFPQPEPNPNPSPQTPVEPGKQIDYTPWLQIIINWLSRIFNKIPEDNEQNQEVEPEVPGIDFSPLQSIDLKDKFPFSLPWDIKSSIELLVDNPQAPRWEIPIVTETITIDFEQFEQLALISRSFLSIIYIIILVILTRRFIGGG